jgi:co-chaperonin GroES (HSP10)
MKSVFDFIVMPEGNRYSNEVDIDGNKLVVNSSIENFKLINRKATVLTVPTAFTTPIQEGEEVIIHQNVVRRSDTQAGPEVDSSKTFGDNKYICQYDQIYLYKRMVKWLPVGEHCFIIPIENNDKWSQEPEQKNKGVVKIGNKTLTSLGINEGDLVGFKSNREFEFIIDKQRLYCMQSNDILVKYEFKGNEEEYNPSWAKSS